MWREDRELSTGAGVLETECQFLVFGRCEDVALVLETASGADYILNTHWMRRATAASSAQSCFGDRAQCWRYPTHTLDAAGGDREQCVSSAGKRLLAVAHHVLETASGAGGILNTH